MNSIVNILNISGEAMIIYGLILAIAVLLIVIFSIDYKGKKKALSEETPLIIEGETPIEKYNTYDQIKADFDKECTDTNKEEIPLEKVEIKEENVVSPVEAIEEKQEEEIEVIEPALEEKKDSIKYVIEDEETKKEEAKEELKELVQELKDEKQENIELTDFEVEQEESAIISYNELKKVSDELYDSNEITQYQDEGNEPISINQLREKFKEVEEKPVVAAVTSSEEESELIETIESLETPKEKEETLEKVKLDDFAVQTGEHKFKMSPVISPVYGTMKEEESIHDDFTSSAKLKLEQTANLEKLDEELKKTNEFLAVLKELKKKLD